METENKIQNYKLKNQDNLNRQCVTMDRKEPLQYVYCVTLSADQEGEIWRKQVEIAWELTSRIIVLADRTQE